MLNGMRMPLSDVISITFSSSEIPFLLGSFECGKIRVKVKVGFRDLSVALPVKVEILEVRNSNDAKTKQLSTFKAQLQSKDANQIVLPHPILIRPGFLYKIRIGPFPDEHVYYSNELKTKVTMSNDSDLLSFYGSIVKLHNSSTENGKAIGLISVLKFNRL